MATSKRKAELQARLERIEQDKERIKQQLKELRAKESAEERKRDTRRKILMGSWVKHLLDSGKMSLGKFDESTRGFFIKAKDRELLGLPPLAEDESQEVEQLESPESL